MSNYFSLSAKDSKQVASAKAQERLKPKHELIPELEGMKELPFEFNLVKLTVEKNGIGESNDLTDLKDIWLDYQPNSLAWPFFSKKLKDIVDQQLTGNEGIDWLSVKINGSGEHRMYYLPRFNKVLDVLDMEKTMFVEDTDLVIIPTFSLSKINKYSISHLPSTNVLCKITHRVYVSERIKIKVIQEKLKGISFTQARVE